MSDVEVMVDCKERLAELEIVISSGMRTFAEVGRALQEIRTSGLYLQSHKTFEAYCKDRWDMRRDYADKMIKAAAVAGNLHAYNCMQIPLTESQCRPLTKLLPEQQLTAWQTIIEIADGGKITARLVNKVVKEMLEEDVDEEVKELCALAILDHDSNTYTCEKRKKPWGILDKIDPCDKCKHFVAVEEVEPEPQRHVIHKGKVYLGIRFADMAIEQLKRIEKDDPQREDAIRRVGKWIQRHHDGVLFTWYDPERYHRGEVISDVVTNMVKAFTWESEDAQKTALTMIRDWADGQLNAM